MTDETIETRDLEATDHPFWGVAAIEVVVEEVIVIEPAN